MLAALLYYAPNCIGLSEREQLMKGCCAWRNRLFMDSLLDQLFDACKFGLLGGIYRFEVTFLLLIVLDCVVHT